MEIFTTLFYQPILNLLVWLFNAIPGTDLGWAIIALTIIIKAILWPLSAKSFKSQKALQELQPKVNELKEKHKDNKEVMNKEMMNLYRQQRVSPFSSCLPLLIQLPFLIAIYRVLISGLNDKTYGLLYAFIPRPETVSTNFLGILSLENPAIILAVIAGILQFFQSRMLTRSKQPDVSGSKDEGMTSMVNKQMMYLMPIITVFIGATLPGGLTLYWTMNTLISLAQQALIFRSHPNATKQQPTP